MTRNNVTKNNKIRNYVTRNSVTNNNVIKNYLTKNNVTRKNVIKNYVTNNNVMKNNLTKNNVTRNNVTKSNVPKNNVTYAVNKMQALYIVLAYRLSHASSWALDTAWNSPYRSLKKTIFFNQSPTILCNSKLYGDLSWIINNLYDVFCFGLFYHTENSLWVDSAYVIFEETLRSPHILNKCACEEGLLTSRTQLLLQVIFFPKTQVV